MAQVQAAHAADIAHETYLENLIKIYQRSGQVIKQHATEEELATLQIKDGTKEAEKLNKAWEEVNAIFQKADEQGLKIMQAEQRSSGNTSLPTRR
jgi:DNA-binding protein H-NS